MTTRLTQSLFKFAAWSLLIGSPAYALAECSRGVNVPIAPIGLSVFVASDKTVSGVYPDVLRSAGAKEGCSFQFAVVPRARLDVLFEAGQADMLIPASKSPSRDVHGVFVPLIFSRATLISLASDRPAIRSARELLDRRDLKVAVVRGFDFGPAYQSLLQELTGQGRIVQDVDALSVARLMQAGAVDLTIMAPSIFVGAIQGDARTEGLLEKLRYEPIDELPWGDSGAYISKTSLSEGDQKALKHLLDRSNTSGAVWKAFQRYYPPKALTGSIRSR
jgi:polar amino acid transport system substrate-binding protein